MSVFGFGVGKELQVSGLTSVSGSIQVISHFLPIGRHHACTSFKHLFYYMIEGKNILNSEVVLPVVLRANCTLIHTARKTTSAQKTSFILAQKK